LPPFAFHRVSPCIRAGANALSNRSKLSVWWLKLGVAIERIKPGNPQHADGKRARFGNAQTIIRRARAGATSIVGEDLLPAIAPNSPLLGRAMGVLQMA
jgi:hypothetical protein